MCLVTWDITVRLHLSNRSNPCCCCSMHIAPQFGKQCLSLLPEPKSHHCSKFHLNPNNSHKVDLFWSIVFERGNLIMWLKCCLLLPFSIIAAFPSCDPILAGVQELDLSLLFIQLILLWSAQHCAFCNQRPGKTFGKDAHVMWKTRLLSSCSYQRAPSTS